MSAMYRPDHISGYSKALAILNTLLGLLLLFAVLVFVRDIINVAYHKKASGDIPSAGPAYKRDIKGVQEYEGILRNNPFGFPGGELKALSGSDASVSQADVKLIGTVSGPQAHSYAIFMDKSGKQEVFKVGESVFGIGKLRKVDTERVSIYEGSRVINIPLTDMLVIKETGAPDSKGVSDLAKSVGSGTFIVDQKKILHALENQNQLMTDARLQPNFINGKQEGFILREVRSGGIYQNLGLQTGDVLLRINDYNISNTESALQAFTALRGMDRVQLDIMRSGSKMTMTYQIR